MERGFDNVYDDAARAGAYAGLEFPGAYFLALRDLPALIAKHVRGTRALDFGCGAGRSTRFLRGLGFSATGVDISRPMLDKAREMDPGGDYRRVADGDLGAIPERAFDLVLAAFTFDNIPTVARKERAFAALERRLAPGGRLISIVSSPEIYVNEWASFTTRDYPENRQAKSGDVVKIVMLDVPDRRPVEDIVCPPEDYQALYGRTGLVVVEKLMPLAWGDEPVAWKSETTIAPWTIYALGTPA